MNVHTVTIESSMQRSCDADSDRNKQATPWLDAQAVARWRATPLTDRLRVIRHVRHALASQTDTLVELVKPACRQNAAETLAAEILPLADACRFLQKQAKKILKPRRIGTMGRPLWLMGVRSVVSREPVGNVLIIAPSNYPLMLPGIQVVQALCAGNGVLVKPAPGCRAAMDWLTKQLEAGGLPKGVMRVLDEQPQQVHACIDANVVQLVLFTGSREVGCEVAQHAASRGIASIMELSGCDALFVLENADVQRVVDALRFSLTFNKSATCIAPRRVFIHKQHALQIEQAIETMLQTLPALAISASIAAQMRERVQAACSQGARVLNREAQTDAMPTVLWDAQPNMAVMREELFAPLCAVMVCYDTSQMLKAYEQCAYRLGASVFGPTRQAQAFAKQIDAGTVVVNDLIVPTADARVPFPTRGASGYGITRGPEGLLAMTQAKVIQTQHARKLAHFSPQFSQADGFLTSWVQLCHSRGLKQRFKALRATLHRAWRCKMDKEHDA